MYGEHGNEAHGSTPSASISSFYAYAPPTPVFLVIRVIIMFTLVVIDNYVMTFASHKGL